jgi:hypothetical protein
MEYLLRRASQKLVELTRSTGIMEAKVPPPESGFLLSQSLAHCDLCVDIASSSARL